MYGHSKSELILFQRSECLYNHFPRMELSYMKYEPFDLNPLKKKSAVEIEAND